MHHGVFTRGEAAVLGVSPEQISRMIRNGDIVRVAPSTFRVATHRESWSSRARAACASTGGALSHRTAAALWGMDGFRRTRIEVTIRYDRPRRTPLATIHRTKQPSLVDERLLEGLPVTGPARTMLDLFAVLSPAKSELAVDAAMRQRLVDWPDLYEVLARHSARGRDGCGRLRTFLETANPDAAIPDSRWNRMVGVLLLDAGLAEPRYEHTIRQSGRFVARVDLAYPRRKLAIELDSVRWHMNQSSFVEDPRRRNQLLLSGWRVLSFTWADYYERPRDLVAAVRAALNHQPPVL